MDRIHVLVVTGHRSDKVIKPLDAASIDYTVVTSDADSLVHLNIELARKAISVLAEANIDLILTDHADISAFVSAILSVRHRVPLVVRLGGNIWQINEKKVAEARRDRDFIKYAFIQLLRTLNRLTFAQASGYIVVSTELKGTIVSRTGIDESMVQIVRVPVDDSVESGDGESLGEALNVRENTVISTVTNLRFEEKYRGVVELFPGMTRFLAENKDAAWVIAGGGYYQQLLEDALQDEINDEDVLSRIYTPGYIENIEDVYDLSTVKVYNSYLDGYPNVVIEAQAAGVPVVTTEQEGMQEQVDHKRTGLFFDPADPAELMAALNRLTSDEQFAREIRERARESVNTRNHPETIAQQFRRALEAITRRASDL